jgi:hypothetical protein
MKITHLLATLLLVSTFATQASAHTRAYKTSHHTYLRTHSLNRGMPLAIERRPTAQYQNPAAAPKDDWPANMILDSFRSHQASSVGKMTAPYVI